jgi:hypothetical protein
MARRFNYERMQGTATRLLDRFQQGTVQLRRITTIPGENEWDPPQEVAQSFPLKATVKRLHQRYENGVLVVETGDLVTFAVPEVTPAITDKIVINGVARVITNLTPIPPSGTVVAYRAWCAI